MENLVTLRIEPNLRDLLLLRCPLPQDFRSAPGPPLGDVAGESEVPSGEFVSNETNCETGAIPATSR